ncbi:MAG: LacI family DNA-binding transcriptional regulator, partial [[Clostridium] leptum]
MEPVRVTLKDIANECGYSVNTVSRALRGDTKLSEQTRKKIQQTAKEKGYIRNNLASSLRSGASHIIAVIVNDIRNQHFTSMISEIELFLRQAGYDMMILCTQLEEQGRQIGTQMVHVAISQSVDGILYFPYSDDKPVVAFLEQSGVPFVLVDRWIPGVYADLVRCDDVSGGYLAGRHLLE